ncbi:MAG: hypothetical protein ACOH12_06020 [Parvibaculaceae bacterium]
MSDDHIRDDIAFIRQAMEEGRAYARLRSPEFAVWGLAIACGYFGTYARVVHLWTLNPHLIWWVPVGLAWAFSLRDVIPRRLNRQGAEAPTLMVSTLRSLWLGYGITIMLFAVLIFPSNIHTEWFDMVPSAMLGLCFFVSSTVSGIRWLRVLAVCWWGAAAALFLVRDQAEVLLLGGIFMLAFLFVPGLVLWLRRPNTHD